MSTQPWTTRKEWSSPKIYSSSKSKLVVTWVLTLIFSIICAAMYLYQQDLIDNVTNEKIAYSVAGFFLFITFLVIVQAIIATKEWLKFGRTPFVMDPYPGSIGGEVGGYITLPIPYHSSHHYSANIELINEYVTRSKSGSNTNHRIIWQTSAPLHAERSMQGTRVRIQASIPEGKAPSEPPSQNYHFWRLSLCSTSDAIKFKRFWKIPVFATNQKCSQPIPNHQFRQHEESSLEALTSLVTLKKDGDKIELNFAPGSRRKSMLAIMSFGLIFTFLGTALPFFLPSFPLIFTVVFALVGTPLFLGGFYGLGRGLQTTISPETIELKNTWFKIPCGEKSIPTKQIEHIGFRRSGSTQSGENITQSYKFYAFPSDSSCIEIGFGIDSMDKAELFGSYLEELTGIKFIGKVESARRRRQEKAS